MKEKLHYHNIPLVFNGRQTTVGTVIELHEWQAIEMVFVLFCTDAENTYTERNLSICHVNFDRWL